MKKILIIFILLIFVVLIGAGIVINTFENYLNTSVDELQVDIAKNEPFEVTYKKIFEHLNPPRFFKYYLGYIMDFKRNRKYGYYYAKDITIKQFIFDIERGREFLIKTVIVEGFNTYDIAENFEKLNIFSKDTFLNFCFNKALIYDLTHMQGLNSLEGFLFPDTYYVPKHIEIKKVVYKMYNNFFKNLPSNFEEKLKQNNLTFYEGIILASIIQKESYKINEYPLVASVFYNRLKQDMPLQSDPTVIYGIYKDFDGDLKKVNLQDPFNLYNTYLHKKLPPTPICNPGKYALEAVINPAKSDYLYFVSTGDGGHVFSKTYQEHLYNVKKYILDR
jgi:UPF0755 protein